MTSDDGTVKNVPYGKTIGTLITDVGNIHAGV